MTSSGATMGNKCISIAVTVHMRPPIGRTGTNAQLTATLRVTAFITAGDSSYTLLSC
jgi:hypothetical protein